MRSSLSARVVVVLFVFVVGLVCVSGQVSQVFAYFHHHYYSGHYWYGYYPYYSYYSYPYCYGYGYYGCYSSYSYYAQPAQYQLTVSADPSNLSSQVTGGGSYNQGSSATFSTGQNMVHISKDTRYVFMRWSGDYVGAGLTGSVTMDASKTVTAVYQLQYLLSLTAPPTIAPSPNGGGWYNAGNTVTLAAPSQAVGGDRMRLVFNGWSVDGGNSQAGSLSLQMNAPHVVVAQYKQQYLLTVVSDEGVPSGTGWYDAGTYAQVSVSTPPDPSYGVRIVFNGWQGDVQSTSQSIHVLMDAPKTLTAAWRTDSTVLYATIAGVLVVIMLIAAAAFYSTQRKRRADTTEFCAQCGRHFRSTNNYCVFCGTPRESDKTRQPP